MPVLASRKDEAAMARLLEERTVFLRGGPYLQRKGEGVEVTERAPAYLWRTEVTRAEYGSFLAARKAGRGAVDPRAPEEYNYTPIGWTETSADAEEGQGAFPVTGVSFYGAMSFAKFVGSSFAVADHDALRAAVEGPQGNRYPWGGGAADAATVNAGGSLGALCPVGTLGGGAGAQGALDLFGNAAEWVGGKSTGRSSRFGGDFSTPTDALNVELSEPVAWEQRDAKVGFRLMWTAPQE